ncbi:hypothetical protein Hanom_Chr00s000005g01612131 [Helianthus anomalus]
MTKIPFPLKGQTTGTIRASSTFLEKNPTTTLSGELFRRSTFTHPHSTPLLSFLFVKLPNESLTETVMLKKPMTLSCCYFSSSCYLFEH